YYSAHPCASPFGPHRKRVFMFAPGKHSPGSATTFYRSDVIASFSVAIFFICAQGTYENIK
ncbi:MAG: hypothetical protein OQK44_07950, partial [Gammaproteobacteria bacterium]|nr:hypothetical protein [Gammaproteobacteria bacterium]